MLSLYPCAYIYLYMPPLSRSKSAIRNNSIATLSRARLRVIAPACDPCDDREQDNTRRA